MRILFTFPGQGAHSPGMLQRLPADSSVQHTLQEAADTLSEQWTALDSADAQQSTVAVQLCLLIAGVAGARLLQQRAGAAELVAGMSIGAFAAAVTAGALDFADALRLVALRGRLMQQAYPAGYGMCVILGLEAPALETVLQRLRGEGCQLYLANLNAERQLVIAGTDAGLGRLAIAARAAGASHCQRLAMSVPSHCPLLQDAAEQLAQAFAGIRLRPLAIPFLSANQARVLRHPAQLADDLAYNMARQVNWHDAMQLAYELGIRLVIEMPPGHALTRLAQPVFVDGEALALADAHPDTIRSRMGRLRSDQAFWM